MYCMAADSGRRGSDHDGEGHGAVSSNLRTTLTMVEAFDRWRRVNADQVLALLVDDGVDCDGGLASLRSPMISSR